MALNRQELSRIGRGPRGDRLKLIRILSKRSQAEVGDLIGYSQQMVAEFESEKSVPSPTVVATLCEKSAGVGELAGMSDNQLVEFAYGAGVLGLTDSNPDDGEVAPTGYGPSPDAVILRLRQTAA